MRRGRLAGIFGATVAAAAMLLPGARLVDAEFPTYSWPNPHFDLTHADDHGRLLATVMLPNGRLVVAEDGPGSFGDGYLHLVRPGVAVNTQNRLGGQLQVAGLAYRAGWLYGLSTNDEDQAHQGSCALYRINPVTGADTVVTYWGHCKSQIAIDPVNGDLAMQADATRNEAIVDVDPASGAVRSVLVPNPPSVDTEAIAFSADGTTIYLGNSSNVGNNNGSAVGNSPDAIYAFSRGASQPTASLVTDASPDGIVVGAAGTCLAGSLMFTTDPQDRSTVPPTWSAHVFTVALPLSATTRPVQRASGPATDQASIWMSSTQAGNALISHDGEVTEMACPQPPPPPLPSPAAAAAPPPPQPQPPPAPVRPPQGNTAANVAPRGGLTLPLGGPGAPGLQVAPVQAAQPAAQGAAQAAPQVGVADAPEDQHSVSLAASMGRAGIVPLWVCLALGAGAVTGMAGAAYALTRPAPTSLRPGGDS